MLVHLPRYPQVHDSVIKYEPKKKNKIIHVKPIKPWLKSDVFGCCGCVFFLACSVAMTLIPPCYVNIRKKKKKKGERKEEGEASIGGKLPYHRVATECNNITTIHFET